MQESCAKNDVYLITTSHYSNDDMIYYRYAKSLASHGYSVKMICVQAELDCKANIESGISFHFLPKEKSRFARFIINPKRIWDYLKIKNDTNAYYFFFTIDMMMYAKRMAKQGYKVVQLFVENYYRKIRYKKWIPKYIRPVVSALVKKEQIKLGNVCTCNIFFDTPTWREYEEIRAPTVLLPNYPIVNSTQRQALPRHFYNGRIKAVFAGGISEHRCINLMAELSVLLQDVIEIHLYGAIENSESAAIIEESNLIYHGIIPYETMLQEEMKYDIGLALYENTEAFSYSCENTTKLFEYMLAGIPIVCNDTKNFHVLVGDTQSGIVVPVDDANACAKRIRELITKPEEMKKMGENGRRMVLDKWNWEAQEKKLIGVVQGG